MGIYDKVPVCDDLWLDDAAAPEFLTSIQEQINAFANKHALQLDEIEIIINYSESGVMMTAKREPTQKEIASRKAQQRKSQKAKQERERKEYERLRKKFEK